MDCLLFDVQVRLHHFFPLSLSLSLCFALHLCSVVWRFDWCGSSACLFYVWIRLAWVCESMPVRALHTCSMSINSFGVSYSSLCFSVSWVHTKLFKRMKLVVFFCFLFQATLKKVTKPTVSWAADKYSSVERKSDVHVCLKVMWLCQNYIKNTSMKHTVALDSLQWTCSTVSFVFSFSFMKRVLIHVWQMLYRAELFSRNNWVFFVCLF